MPPAQIVAIKARVHKMMIAILEAPIAHKIAKTTNVSTIAAVIHIPFPSFMSLSLSLANFLQLFVNPGNLFFNKY